MTLSERTLGDWLEHWAETTPDKEYIVYSDRNLRFTWKQFNEPAPEGIENGQSFLCIIQFDGVVLVVPSVETYSCSPVKCPKSSK